MQDATNEAVTHPEEMRASYALRIGSKVTLSGTARVTPAGLVTAGIAVSLILVSCAAVIRAARAR